MSDGQQNNFLRWGAGVIASLLTAATIGIFVNLVQLNRDMIGVQAWREQITAQNSVPREVLELREKITAGQINQLEIRLSTLENRR